MRLIALLRNAERPSPAWVAPFNQLLTGERGGVIVAEEDGRLLGAITYSFNIAIRYGGEYAQIEELIVDPAARGRSLGRLLVEAAIAAARTRGCAEIGLYGVNPDNVPFYARFGFEAVGPEVRLDLR